MNFLEPSVDELVRADHAYRKLLALIDLSQLLKPIKHLRSGGMGRPGYRLESGFAALLLQWMEDLSDRELERFLQENTAGKFFCGFSLREKTPDHSYFGELRRQIGTSKLAEIFRLVNRQLRAQGVVMEVFTFVDAQSLISKLTTWSERDAALAAGEEKLNNTNVEKFSADGDARFGCKGKEKFWYGYKRNVAVDMKHGIITKVAVTPANEADGAALKHVCPRGGMVVADKAYCTQEAQQTLARRGCHSGAILKNNMKRKNKDKDRFLTKLRAPYENIFSKQSKRCRYRGLAKVQFQGLMEAFVFNFRRLVAINSPPLFA